jgi:outer membrane protein assembly factor BamB
MALILKYSADGDLLWEYARVGSAWAIAIDHSGNVYWTGNSGYPTDKFYTSQLTPNGQYVWGENFVHGSGNAIALDRQNNVYVTGGARASSGGGEIATLAYAADGTILWSQRYDYGRDYDSGKDLVVDEAGYVYVSGDSMYDFATIKYESLLRPYITIPDALGIEGESGTQPLEVHVELSAVLPTDSTVKYTTTSGTAKAGQDFQSASGTLTIPANKDWVAIPIQILSDTQKEGSETFQVILSDPTGADLVDSEAVVTIWDAGSVLRFMPLSISVK